LNKYKKAVKMRNINKIKKRIVLLNTAIDSYYRVSHLQIFDKKAAENRIFNNMRELVSLNDLLKIIN